LKKIITTLLVLGIALAFIGNVFATEHADTYFIDIKIGKSYPYDEKIKVEATENIMVYNKSNKDLEVLDLNVNSLLITYFPTGRVDVYSSDSILLYSMAGDGSVLLGTKSGVEGVLTIAGNRYRGYVTLINGKEVYNVINHLSVEKYLYGVLPKEFPTSAPIESIKAQAVTARSFSYSNMNKHIGEGFNLCDTIHCQVYAGYDGENVNSNRAIDETKGMVVTYNGKIAETVYHSNSGGHTASSENVWRSKLDYLAGVEDPFSLNTNGSNWSFTMTKAELSQRLIAQGTDVGQVTHMEILETFPSGRVSNLKIVGSNNEINITGANLRTILGSTLLKSTLFSVDTGTVKVERPLFILSNTATTIINPEENLSVMSNNSVQTIENKNVSILSANGISKVNTVIETNSDVITFNGKGFGHGVGMSQYGALEMSKAGFTYDQILKFYYTGVDITTINR